MRTSAEGNDIQVDLEILLENVLNALTAGITIGCIYGLMCIGLGLIFGIMRVVNFAQGELLMLGMFASLYLVTGAGVLAFATWTVAGLAAERTSDAGDDHGGNSGPGGGDDSSGHGGGDDSSGHSGGDDSSGHGGGTESAKGRGGPGSPGQPSA